MNSKTTEHFWKCYEKLPLVTKKQAKKAYKQFQKDPYYPALHFKQVHSTRPIFSVRITKDYRAIYSNNYGRAPLAQHFHFIKPNILLIKIHALNSIFDNAIAICGGYRGSAELKYQLPIYQEVNGIQQVLDWKILASIVWNF